MRIKAICIIGGGDGCSPARVKLYKNVDVCDANICEEKKAHQQIDLVENMQGEIDNPVNVSKWNNTQNIVIGFDQNFGGDKTIVHYIGIKGEMLR